MNCSAATDLSNALQQLKKHCEQAAKNYQAGTVCQHKKFWALNCKDPSVLNLVSGIPIIVKSQPYQSKIPNEITFSRLELECIDQEISKMLAQGVIEPVPYREACEYISNIFVRPKKDGGVRVILNLREFNEFVDKSHFKMQSLQSAIDLMTPDAFLASVDFKSAYYSIPIKRAHRKYLRFYYRGLKYQFAVLPNGLTTGPRDFTQVVKSLFRILREKGHLNTFYLDDSLLAHKTFLGCLENVIDTVKCSLNAGFYVHPEKSILVPTKRLVFLGFLLCTETMTVRLTAEKCDKIKAAITNVLKASQLTIQEVAELVGQLVASFPGVPLGKLYYRQIDNEKSRALKRAGGSFAQNMTLSKRAISDLNWWFCNIDSCFTKIESKNPSIVIKTDASNFGFGGCTNTESFHGHFDESDVAFHINQKELLAVLYSLQNLCLNVHDTTVKILTDNTTTLSYINNMGGKFSGCNEIARKIWMWASQRRIWLVCSYIPGKLNVEADRLSRVLNETTEWSLKRAHFDSVMNRFPGLEIDLFASHLNRKMDQYVSWLPDQNAAFCDAFSLDWSEFYAYAFPPFNLIGKVLRKVQLDRASMVIIVPEWRSQYWFSILMSLLTDEPFYLPRNARAICNPINQRAAPVTARFVACSISGCMQKIRSYLRP